jgi:polyphosphate kinase 2 (PPK2 family)
MERLTDPTKNWKATPEDFAERKRWDAYIEAYGDAIEKCSTAHAPWFVVPSDHKWFRNLAVSQIIIETLGHVRMSYPKPTFDVSKIRIE